MEEVSPGQSRDVPPRLPDTPKPESLPHLATPSAPPAVGDVELGHERDRLRQSSDQEQRMTQSIRSADVLPREIFLVEGANRQTIHLRSGKPCFYS